MKITQISFFIISILFFGCTNINKENSTTLTLNDVQKIISKDTVIDHNFIMDSRMKSQIDLYEHLFSEYIFCVYFDNDIYFYKNDLYLFKLLNTFNNSFTLKFTSQVDSINNEFSDHYLVNKSGYLLKVQNVEDPYWRKEFEYKNGLLVEVKNYSKTPSLIGKSENRIDYIGGDKYQGRVNFTYENNLLTEIRYSEDIFHSVRLYFISYYVDKQNPSQKYIVKRKYGRQIGEEIICFNNSDIQYVIFNSETYGVMKDVYKFNWGDVSSSNITEQRLTIDYFYRKKSSVDYKWSKTYNISIDNQNNFKKIIETLHNKEEQEFLGLTSREILFKYIFDHNQLIGYGIFKYEEQEFSDEDKKVEKSQTIIKRLSQ